MLTKMRKVVSFDKLESSLKRELLNEYPYGFGDAVMKIEASEPFYAVLLEVDDASYLVKLNKYQVESGIELDDDEDDYDSEDDIPGDLELDEN